MIVFTLFSKSYSRMFSSQRIKFMIIASLMVVLSSASDYNKDFDIVWGNRNARIRDDGHLLELSLDEKIGSRIQSRDRYMYGHFDLEIKLVKGESAGTITSFYICTGGMYHDEVDFEFLGNVSGEPYVLHTNFFINGTGGKEEQFSLWFDPTEDFHTYSILWNPINIILFIDGTPIRVFKNKMEYGIAYPTSKPVRVFASIWNAEEWATQGGQIKTNWSKAPFTAYYRHFNLSKSCVMKSDGSNCENPDWMEQKLDWWSWMTLSWVRMNYLLYDYCSDTDRFPKDFPPECLIL